jgi:signal transduction histidine kinase
MATIEQRILDALPGIVCTVDLDGRVTGINRSRTRLAADLADLPIAGKREPLGVPVHEALGPAGPREHLESAMALLRTGRAQNVTWEVPRGAGPDDATLLVQATPLLDRASVAGFCFSLTDITESRRIQDSLVASGIALARAVGLERVFQEVAHQARQVMSAEALAIALADEQTAALHLAHQFGFSEETATIEQRLGPAWMNALAHEGVATGTETTSIELTAAVMGAEGAIGAMTVSLGEVDSPHRLDEARRQLSTLALQVGAAIEHAWLMRTSEHKRRLEAIGEVAAGVAHELRNPLFGIASAAQLLRFRAKDDPVIETNVGRILREVERMNRMSTALLEYGRPHPVRLTPGDPDSVWDQVLEAERGRLETSAIVVSRTHRRTPARCAIDSEQLAQVFGNVLVNAVDAAPEGSDISLTTEVLPTGAWRCRLRNSGPVVPKDVLGRAFEIFFSTKPGAAGLGLAISQRIIEEHGGTITLESAANVGTTLSIVLPPAA